MLLQYICCHIGRKTRTRDQHIDQWIKHHFCTFNSHITIKLFWISCVFLFNQLQTEKKPELTGQTAGRDRTGPDHISVWFGFAWFLFSLTEKSRWYFWSKTRLDRTDFIHNPVMQKLSVIHAPFLFHIQLAHATQENASFMVLRKPHDKIYWLRILSNFHFQAASAASCITTSKPQGIDSAILSSRIGPVVKVGYLGVCSLLNLGFEETSYVS